MTADADDVDDLDRIVEADIASTGAAVESAETNEMLKRLPRILRYAALAEQGDQFLRERLVAEIAELAPGITETIAWAASDDPAVGVALAATLDRLAATQDQPDLRALADCARLLSLPLPGVPAYEADHRRVAKVLLQAINGLPSNFDLELAADIEAIGLGWAVLPAHTAPLFHLQEPQALAAAVRVGRQMAARRVAFTEARLREEFDEEKRALEEAATKKAARANPPAKPVIDVPPDHVMVCSMAEADMKTPKMREIVGPLKSAINVALPLVQVPPLHDVRNQLLFEFPYAVDAIDFALANLIVRRTVRLRPLLLLGQPGSGKSRFVRRLGELLGVGVWREDASRSDSAVFGGTDKRWNSAEPCHPFLAIARFNQANPIVLVDEVEKAGTRSDHGRLWDCLLAFFEPETAARYPDPAVQVTLDLSHVSFVGTANSLDRLPAPLRDRFRTVTFPQPGEEHLDSLLPHVMADLAAESGLDRRWIEPLSGTERDLVVAHWQGGSIRQLRRLVEVLLREREMAAVRN